MTTLPLTGAKLLVGGAIVFCYSGCPCGAVRCCDLGWSLSAWAVSARGVCSLVEMMYIWCA